MNIPLIVADFIGRVSLGWLCEPAFGPGSGGPVTRIEPWARTLHEDGGVIFEERPLEVLVVDDEAPTRELLEQFCHQRKFPVAAASDGRAAISALERHPSRFAVVLTDINMPGADGFEVLKAARSVNASRYVVMITGYATLNTALRAVRDGAYDYLAKPFSLGQLDVMFARIKDRITLEQENRELRRRLGAQAPARVPAQSGMLYASILPPVPIATAPLQVHNSIPAPRVDVGSHLTVEVTRAEEPPLGLTQRVAAIEDRLASIEDLLREAVGRATASILPPTA
jgi:CheY-like chemotaxis protein